MASGLRCAKAPRMTQGHSLLLRGEKGHGTTTGQHTAVTRVAQGGDKAPGGAGSARRKRCCPFPAGDKHAQDLCFSSALGLCHSPALAHRQKLVCAGWQGHRGAAAPPAPCHRAGTSRASLPPRPCLTLKAASHRFNQGQTRGVPSRRAPFSLESSTPGTPARRAEPWGHAWLTPQHGCF